MPKFKYQVGYSFEASTCQEIETDETAEELEKRLYAEAEEEGGLPEIDPDFICGLDINVTKMTLVERFGERVWVTWVSSYDKIIE